MAKILRVIGLLLMLYAVACFIVNVGIWHPWLLGDIAALWNPLSLVTPLIVGDIPIIGGSLGWILNGIFAIIWSFAVFIIGILLVK